MVDLLDNVANVREKVLQEVLAVLREGMQQRSHLVAVKPQEVAKVGLSSIAVHVLFYQSSLAKV